MFARSQLNRAIVLVALIVALPVIAIAERLSPGRGRKIAVSAIRTVARLCGIRFVVQKCSELEPGATYIFVPNHSSPLDIPAVLMGHSDVQFLAAQELFRIPLLASAMRALNTEPIARRDPEVARQQLTNLVEKRKASSGVSSLVIFPEGGIPPRGERRPFKKGAFSLAIQTGVPIAPVAIRHSDDVLPPRSRLAARPGTVEIEFLAPISTADHSLDDWEPLRDQASRAIIDALAEA